MKKMLSALAAVVMLSSAFVTAKTTELVSIDSILIMQKSQEGKELAAKIQKDVDAFQEEIRKTQKDLTDQQEALNKQAKILSKEALQEKSEELANKRKKYERDFADKEEALRASIQNAKWLFVNVN